MQHNTFLIKLRKFLNPGINFHLYNFSTCISHTTGFPFIQDLRRLFTYFKRWSNKNETININSDDSTGLIVKISFFNNFVQSIVLSLNYQLSFLQSGRFPDKMNWTGVQLDLTSLSGVLEVWKKSQNISTDRHNVFSWNIEVQSKSSVRGCDGFSFKVCLNAVHLLRLSPIHIAWKSTTLEKRQIVAWT